VGWKKNYESYLSVEILKDNNKLSKVNNKHPLSFKELVNIIVIEYSPIAFKTINFRLTNSDKKYQSFKLI